MLHAGMRDGEEQATRALIAGIVALPVNQQVAELAGQMKREARGHVLDLADCLIAATAVVEGIASATRNTRHYPFDALKVIVPSYT